MVLHGNAVKYGDNIDTDVIIPARYLNTSDPAELAKHCMEDIDKSFTSKVKPGDVMVGEVSRVNDDFTDNCFVDGMPRFDQIEEDEPARYLLGIDYRPKIK